MSKRQLIDAIRRHNPSVNDEFLMGFEPLELESYLQRLTRLAGHRGRESGWVRLGDTPAVVMRHGRYARMA